MEKKSAKNLIVFSVCAVMLVVLTAGLYFLNSFYVPECDELYFTAWRFDSVGDMLLSKPDASPEYVIGLMHNGRLLGNLFGVLESRMYFGGYEILRSILFTAGIMILSLLAGRFAFGKYSKSVFIAAALLICMPKGFYANVWSWGVSYVNFVLPSIGLFAAFILMEKSGKRSLRLPAIFLLAFTSQLYVENLTIALCLWAALLLFDGNYKKPERITASGGFISGAAAMFLSPEYKTVAAGGSIHSAVSEPYAVFENLGELFRLAFVRYAALLILTAAALLFSLWKSGRKATAAAVFIMMTGSTAAALFLKKGGVTAPLTYAILFAILSAGMVTGCLSYGDKFKKGTKQREEVNRKRYRLISVLAVAAATLLPLAVLENETSFRLFFPGYVFLGVLLMLLLPDKLASGSILPILSLALCIAYVSFLLPIYRDNHKADEERISIGLEAASKGENEVTLPLLPHSDYATNEYIGKGDLSFIVYKNEPFDVKLDFVPYEEYYQ